MMPVWQWESMFNRYKAQCVRKDGHRADLYATTAGVWSVYDSCDESEPIARGKAATLDSAQLLARLVWELSA